MRWWGRASMIGLKRWGRWWTCGGEGDNRFMVKHVLLWLVWMGWI